MGRRQPRSAVGAAPCSPYGSVAGKHAELWVPPAVILVAVVAVERRATVQDHRLDGTSDARGLTCWPVGRKNVLASEKGVDFRLAEAPVPSGGADTADAACRSPARNRLWVYPEEGGNLSWGQQTLA